MPHSFGYRARTRDMFARPFRQRGMIKLSTYLRTFKVGDYVDIKANGAIHKGMPHKFYHGRTGRVYNVTKRAVGVRVNKVVGNRIIHKHINVRIEHVHQSKCRQGFLDRVKENERKKKEAHATGVRQEIKRQPVQPKAAYTLKTKGSQPITMAPQPFVDLIAEQHDNAIAMALSDLINGSSGHSSLGRGDGSDAPAMTEADMEQCAQWLDELYEKDPQAYEQLMATMKAQVAAASTGSSAEPSMLDLIKNASSSGAAPMDDAFKPRFPGNKVMEKDGLGAQQEGIYIDVEPGFVMKTTDMGRKSKVFVNVCQSDAIQTFSQRKQLDENGEEQEGIHVPLSLGPPHEVTDKSGASAIAFDVAVNTQVIADCQKDTTGSFRNFVCELAIEYIDQKHKVKLDARYKLPKMKYAGELPPPRHYIRKTQKPIIEEVQKPSTAIKPSTKSTPLPAKKDATATCRCYELVNGEPSRPATQWDPVHEDEELPEDRFHRRDMMSMHILEQRKKEREQKTKEADAKRLAKRAEIEEKRRKAREAGKTWREMYPDEPETTYIDMEDILADEKRKRQQANDYQSASAPGDSHASISTSDVARRAAAAWSDEKAAHGLNLSSALAFDLL
ncbi:hypothetical protein ATCC90586_009012 [Pythium insidiosum]|nr:hypothetical protein ATCC90586_009012 [Pythium insidiosum]